MDKNPEKKKLLKDVILYQTFGIIVFATCFILQSFVEIPLFGKTLDLQMFSNIFLACMFSYSMPQLLKLSRMMD